MLLFFTYNSFAFRTVFVHNISHCEENQGVLMFIP